MHLNFYFHKTFSFTVQLVLLPRLPDTKFTPQMIMMIVGRILVDYSVYYGVSYPRTCNILSLVGVGLGVGGWIWCGWNGWVDVGVSVGVGVGWVIAFMCVWVEGCMWACTPPPPPPPPPNSLSPSSLFTTLSL